ncbi:MAG: hypothetical protein HUU38_27830 [Anaerolineales bacterium]|nr:hypothetical protein [Anaerolineales bacterium]
MSKILFINQPTLGHLNTLRSIAAQMQEDGHNVHFLIPGMRERRTHFQILETAFQVQEILTRDHLAFEIMPPALTTLPVALLLPHKSGYEEIVHAINLFSQGIDHYTRQILKFIQRYAPDVIVTDFAFPASRVAAEIANIPYVVIYHSGLPFRGEGVPPFGSGLPIGTQNHLLVEEYEQKEKRILQTLDARLNLVLQKYGLPASAPELLRRPYSPWLNLIASATEAEAPRNNLTANTFYIGPCIGKRVDSHLHFPFEKLQTKRYKIYVSLGTVFNNKPDVFRKIISALDTPVYQVIISAGGAYEILRQEHLPSNVLLFEEVPQIDLLPKINLFISHGGNNSTNEALAAGKPLIILPIGGEQADNASRAEYLGVGLRLDINHFTEAQLLTAVEKIRIGSTYEMRAKTIMQSLQKTQGPHTASRCIDWIARHRQPLLRPDHLPLTITPYHLPQLLDVPHQEN